MKNSNLSHGELLFNAQESAADRRFLNCPPAYLMLSRHVLFDKDINDKFCVTVKREETEDDEPNSDIGVNANFSGVICSDGRIRMNFQDDVPVSDILALYENIESAEELARAADCPDGVSFSVCKIEVAEKSLIINEIKEFCKQNLVKVELMQNEFYISKEEYEDYPEGADIKRLCFD